jgi:hypothetical protein
MSDNCTRAFDAWRKVYRVKHGTRVRILRGFDIDESDCELNLSDNMTRHIGNTGTVAYLFDKVARINTNYPFSWAWPFFCLEVIKQD